MIASPQEWAAAFVLVATALGGAFVWAWNQWGKRAKADDELRDRVSKCEQERALLRREVDELRGAVKTLTDLLKVETHIG